MATLTNLADPRHTSVSVITPPNVTLKLLEESLRLGIPSLWLQPGSFDDRVMSKVKQLEGTINIIAQGRCILVEGSEDLAISEAHGGRKL